MGFLFKNYLTIWLDTKHFWIFEFVLMTSNIFVRACVFRHVGMYVCIVCVSFILIQYSFRLQNFLFVLGGCLFLNKRNSKIDWYDCTSFPSGCPDEPYRGSLIYKCKCFLYFSVGYWLNWVNKVLYILWLFCIGHSLSTVTCNIFFPRTVFFTNQVIKDTL